MKILQLAAEILERVAGFVEPLFVKRAITAPPVSREY